MNHRLAGRRRRGDRGAVFVEFALAVPLLMLFAMGIIEYGIGWKAANDVNAAARDAARAGTSAPAYLTADRAILISIGSSLTAEQRDNIQQIIVYKAGSANGQPSTTCKGYTNTSGSASSPGTRQGNSTGSTPCNVYGKGQVAYALANQSNTSSWVNGAGTGCGSLVDSRWCPATRAHSLVAGSLDYLGVYIKMEHESITNFGFGDRTIERNAVFRLEPSFGGD